MDDPVALMPDRSVQDKRRHKVTDVFAEPATPGKDPAIRGDGRRILRRCALPLQPGKEITIVVWIERHAVCRDIDAVRGIVGIVGQPAPKLISRLEHYNAHLPGRQLGGKSRSDNSAAETPANDCHDPRASQLTHSCLSTSHRHSLGH
jgi:hypothetical protein